MTTPNPDPLAGVLEIVARHEAIDPNGTWDAWRAFKEAHADRATLLRVVEAYGWMLEELVLNDHVAPWIASIIIDRLNGSLPLPEARRE